MNTIENSRKGFICPLALLCKTGYCNHRKWHTKPVAECDVDPCEDNSLNATGIVCRQEEPLQSYTPPTPEDDDYEDEDWDTSDWDDQHSLYGYRYVGSEAVHLNTQHPNRKENTL